MTARYLGLTTRLSLTATSLGSRKDVINRRIATDLGANPNFTELNFILSSNDETNSVLTSKRVIENISYYVLIHTDTPLQFLITNNNNTISMIIQDLFVTTSAISRIEITNLSIANPASVTAVYA